LFGVLDIAGKQDKAPRLGNPEKVTLGA
jgi:hypothetical protein